MEKSEFLKIIYFDESFVADYMQIMAGGELKKTTEFISEVSSDMSGKAEGSVSVNTEKKGLAKIFSFLSGISVKAEASGELDYSRSRDKIAKNILENTLLADFVALIESDKKRKDKNKKCTGIEIFPQVTVYPETDSFSYIMLMAPFLQMVNGDIPIDSSDGKKYSLNISKVEEAMNKGRGYYEFIANLNGVEKIFRFNFRAFRNNYTMSDLPKMSLTYYAIKVGKIDKADLQMQKEFEFGAGNISKRVDYAGINKDFSNLLDVYDVVLAGVVEANE